MQDDVLDLAARLRDAREPFALATVVARGRPQSVSIGARAVVRLDGSVEGWVGGGCVRPTVVDEALQALEDGEARLVRIGVPPEADPPPGVRIHPMTCHGGGRVEVYVEPVFPAPRLVVFGVTPVARALAELATPLGFEVAAVDPRADEDAFPSAASVERSLDAASSLLGADSFAVVATQGEGDEDALRVAVSEETAYLGLVASRKKGATVLAFLEGEGIPAAELERVRYPAGLDLGGMKPAEIALSILAEIVAVRAGRDPATTALPPHRPSPAKSQGLPLHPPMHAPAQPQAAGGGLPGFAKDPVCGMTVQIEGARHRSEHAGVTVYFCCPMCKAAFDEDPSAYSDAVASPGGRAQ